MLNLLEPVADLFTAKNGKSYDVTQIPSDPAKAQQVQEKVNNALVAASCSEKEQFAVHLALEEGLVNAIKHGNRLDRNKSVDIAYKVCAEQIEVHLRDQGDGFDPDDLPDPLAPENIERCCGRGIMLMRHYMSEVIVHPPGNTVSMFLKRGQAAD